MADDLATWLRGVLDEDETSVRHLNAVMPPEMGDRAMSRAWMLADIEAKRAMLDEHFESALGDTGLGSGGCTTCMNYAWPCPTLRLLASPYRDRDGYREEWAPSA